MKIGGLRVDVCDQASRILVSSSKPSSAPFDFPNCEREASQVSASREQLEASAKEGVRACSACETKKVDTRHFCGTPRLSRSGGAFLRK